MVMDQDERFGRGLAQDCMDAQRIINEWHANAVSLYRDRPRKMTRRERFIYWRDERLTRIVDAWAVLRGKAWIQDEYY